MFKNKKTYYVQWRYDQVKMWFGLEPYHRKKKALKHAFKMLARNSNTAPWRVVEFDKETNELTIIFESSIDRVPLSEYNLKQFTGPETKKYCPRTKKEKKK